MPYGLYGFDVVVVVRMSLDKVVFTRFGDDLIRLRFANWLHFRLTNQIAIIWIEMVFLIGTQVIGF